MRRAFIAGALAFGTVFLMGGAMGQAGLPENSVQAAPSTDVGTFRLGAIRFATEVQNEFMPVNPQVEFSSGTDVWVVTEYVGYTSGVLSFLVRANEADYAWGRVPNCCQFSERRIGFKLDHRGEYGAIPPTVAQPGILSALGVAAAPAGLPGAAYNVIFYLNDEEVGQAGFGIKGREGLDNDNQSNDND
jgi:hypothetical protein